MVKFLIGEKVSGSRWMGILLISICIAFVWVGEWVHGVLPALAKGDQEVKGYLLLINTTIFQATKTGRI